MARFDFIEAAASGYRFFMREHRVIGQLALVPLTIKLVSFAGILTFGVMTDFLRQGLVLLPAFFAEGWLVTQLIRLAIYNERWPASLSGDQKRDVELFFERSRCILSGTIVYVLIKLSLSLISGLVMLAGKSYGGDAVAPEATTITYLAGMLVLGGMIWAFRLLWLYVPVTLGFSMAGFLRRIRPFHTSFYMLGAWLLCFMPMAMILLMVSEVFASIFPPGAGEQMSKGYQYAMVSVQAIVETLIAVISSVALAYGVKSIYEGPKKRP